MTRSRPQTWGLGVALVIVTLVTVLHNPFGGYARRDGLYTRLEFLRVFREAFSEYHALSDVDLLETLLTKYPAFKTWIREETDGSPPLAVAITDRPTNYRMNPPPAYYGARAGIHSRYALAPWMDEPAEYAGVVLPVVVAAAVWLWLFRRRSLATERDSTPSGST
jgi:hypothetical protein